MEALYTDIVFPTPGSDSYFDSFETCEGLPNDTVGLPISDYDSNLMKVEQMQQRSWEDRFQACKIGPFRYFAVFDGHSGTKRMGKYHVADYLVENLHKRLAFKLSTVDITSENEVTNILIKAFTDFDNELYNNDLLYGSTCTVVLIHDEQNRIYQVNLGDSRSIIFDDNGNKTFTVDHDPNREDEKQRIRDAGGFVSYGRLQGVIAVSRAFGDFEFKINKSYFNDSINGQMCAVPDVTVSSITRPSYILLTSDAPFENDSFTNYSLVEAVQDKIKAGVPHDIIVKDMVNAVAARCTDDVTIMLVTV